MPLIIDTYNVLHVVGVLPPDLAGIDTLGLIRLMAASRYRHEKATLVCDGIPHEQAPTGNHGPITIRYSGSNRLADDVIHDLIQRSSIPKRLLVVSSDHEILRSARRRRCRSLTSDRFLEHLVNDFTSEPARETSARPTKGLNPQQARQWADEFGIDDAFLEHVEPESPPIPATDPPHAVSGLPGAKPATCKAPEDPLPPDVLREAENLLENEPESPSDESDPQSPVDEERDRMES